MKTKLLLFAFLLIAVNLISNNARATYDPTPETRVPNKTEEILGTVYHSDSRKPLRDVLITAYTSNKKEFRAYTDHQGNYSFNDLKPGVYRIVFERGGYRKVSRDKVLIKTGDGYHLDIGMEEVAEYNMIPGIFNFSGEE